MPVRYSGPAFQSERSLTSQSSSTIVSQDGHRKLTSPQIRATSATTTPPRGFSVLSASLYPIPEVQSQNSGVRDQAPAYGGYVLEQEIKNDGGNFSAQSSPGPLSSGVQNKTPKHACIKPGEKTKTAPSKRGRPRKIVNLDNSGPDEVGFLFPLMSRCISVIIVPAFFHFLYYLFFFHSRGFFCIIS